LCLSASEALEFGPIYSGNLVYEELLNAREVAGEEIIFDFPAISVFWHETDSN